MFKLLQNTDFYKTGHVHMYPQGTKKIHSVWTARNGIYSNSNNEGTIHFGVKYFVNELQKAVDEILRRADFHEQQGKSNDLWIELAAKEYQDFIKQSLGQDNYDVRHIKILLHYITDLRELPIIIKSVAEGGFYQYQTPLVTIENTDPYFSWLPNYLETWFSSTMWLTSTSATTSWELSKLADHSYQMHDFSYRGMGGNEGAVLSGMGHLLFNQGSDSIPSILKFKELYHEDNRHLGSVVATEHSVMCSYGQENELNTYRTLIEKYPKGILSVVSDTWNYWSVLRNVLPTLKDAILARDGKVVIRPDSGTPIDIICGTILEDAFFECYPHSYKSFQKGSLRLLWDTFGGTIDDKGLKVLNEKVGLIYGDGMTLDTIAKIKERVEKIGFSTSNLVFGVGSYQYQFVTRDTHSFAFKATAIQDIDGNWSDLSKNPVTDSKKKSLSGRFELPYEAYPIYEVPLIKEEQ